MLSSTAATAMIPASAKQRHRSDVKEQADEVESVGRRSDQHLNQGQEIQVPRTAVRFERVFEIETVQRNVEGQVAQPQRPLDEIVFVPEKAPERHLRMIGDQKEADDYQDAQRDGDHHQT